MILGLLQIVDFEISLANVMVGTHMIGLDIKCATVIGESLIEILQPAVHVTKSVVGLGAVRRGGDDGCELHDGAVVFPSIDGGLRLREIYVKCSWPFDIGDRGVDVVG